MSTIKELKNLIRKGEIEEVKRLLVLGEIDPNQVEREDGSSLLSVACLNNRGLDHELIELLLEKLNNAPVDIQNEIYHSTITKAIKSLSLRQNRVVDVIKLLFDQHKNLPQVETVVIFNLLCFACDHERENVEVVKFLVEKDSESINTNDNLYWSPLMYASKRGYINVIEVLLENGAQIDYQMDSGKSALMVATEYRVLESIKILVERGAEVDLQNRGGESALLYRIRTISYPPYFIDNDFNNDIIISALLDKGASINLADVNGETPLRYAIKHKLIKCVKLLLTKKDPWIDLERNCSGWSPLHYAISVAQQRRIRQWTVVEEDNTIAKMLLDKGAPVNLVDAKHSNESPLMIACKTMNTEMCKLLILEYEAKVDLLDDNGAYALLHAANRITSSRFNFTRDGSMVMEIIELLLEKDDTSHKIIPNNGESAAGVLYQRATSLLRVIDRTADGSKFPKLKALLSDQQDTQEITDPSRSQKKRNILATSASQHDEQPAKRRRSGSSSSLTQKHITTQTQNIDELVVRSKQSLLAQVSDDSRSPDDPNSSQESNNQSPTSSQDGDELESHSHDFQVNSEHSESPSDSNASFSIHSPTDSHCHFSAYECKFNLVLYGVDESSKGTPRHERMAHDCDRAFSILSAVLKEDDAFTVNSIRDCSRLGKYSPAKTRPLLVRLQRSRDVSSILQKVSQADSTRGTVSIKRYMSPAEKKVESILLQVRLKLVKSAAGMDKKDLKIKGNELLYNSSPIGRVENGKFIITVSDT